MVHGPLGGVFEPVIPEWAYQDGNEYFVGGVQSPNTNITNSVDHIVKCGDRMFLMGVYAYRSHQPYYVTINAMEYFPDTNTLGTHKQVTINLQPESWSITIGADNGIYLLCLDRSGNTYKYDYDTNTASIVSNFPYRDSYNEPDGYGITGFFDNEDGNTIYAHINQMLYRFSTITHAYTTLPKNTAFVRNDYNLGFAGICRLSSINSICVYGGYWYNDAGELYTFDLSTQAWTYKSHEGLVVGSCNISSYPDGNTFVMLGSNYLFNGGKLNTCHAYTGTTNTWTDLLSMSGEGGGSPQVTVKDTVYRMYNNSVLLYINKAFY